MKEDNFGKRKKKVGRRNWMKMTKIKSVRKEIKIELKLKQMEKEKREKRKWW